MFSKINKKVLIILIVALIIILSLAYAVFKYAPDSNIGVQNLAGGAQTQQGAIEPANNITGDPSNPPTVSAQLQIPAGQIQVQGDIDGKSGGGLLSICLVKCGDGICQKSDTTCGIGNNSNCICPETPQECPEDCK